MPKSTYYNIAKAKQKKLIDVGVLLFSKNQFEDVDVQMIVNLAGVPRGSFYAYFENLEDYYNLIITSLRNDRVRIVKTLAEGFDGSLFDFLIKLFEYDITLYAQDERKLLMTHYLKFLQTRKMGSFEGTVYHPSLRIGIYSVLVSLLMNNDETSQLDDMKKASLIDFAMSVYLATYNVCIHEKMSEADSLELFIERIKIIERGVK
ncbi:MAG: TetR/AcrR family transcriptional regulator [Tenericutes bacterium]|jgi:AcrR family transcriptional regulator|nr:TetR/AcrR family transcriptional regulator [Mycoplasmatota bacterium]